MKTVAFVPIKLNSQRLPHKNILPFGDKPLCWHVINELINVEQIDEVYVYCSDEKIINYIPKEAKFLKRNPNLDGDLVKGFDIYKSFIDAVDADIYVLAHTTSPFLKSSTISSALLKILEGNYDSAFSAKKVQTFAWFNNEPINYDLNDIPRTQDIEPVYVETSGFFMFKQHIFTKHQRRIGFKPYIQEIDEYEAVDIDTKEDYEFALNLIKTLNENGREKHV